MTRPLRMALGVIPLLAVSSATSHTIPRDCGDFTWAGRHVTTIGDGDATLHIDVRDVWGTGFDEVDRPVEDAIEPEDERGDRYRYSIWIYLESGNHPGLQTKKGTPAGIFSDGEEVCSTGKHSNRARDASDILLW